MSRIKYSAEFRAKISQECIDGIGTIRFLANKYGIGYSTLKGWRLMNIKFMEYQHSVIKRI